VIGALTKVESSGNDKVTKEYAYDNTLRPINEESKRVYCHLKENWGQGFTFNFLYSSFSLKISAVSFACLILDTVALMPIYVYVKGGNCPPYCAIAVLESLS
jgi:hypothetical protein